MLRNLGVKEIKGAYDGEEALQIVGNVEIFDLILLDIQMPKMNGLECARAIRKLNDPKRRTKIYLCTGNVMTTEMIEETKQLDFAGYLSKPINKQCLVEILK